MTEALRSRIATALSDEELRQILFDLLGRVPTANEVAIARRHLLAVLVPALVGQARDAAGTGART